MRRQARLLEFTLLLHAVFSHWYTLLIFYPMYALTTDVVGASSESPPSGDHHDYADLTCDSTMSCDDGDSPIWYLREGELKRLPKSSFRTINRVIHAADDDSSPQTNLATASVPGGESVHLQYVRNFLTQDEVRRLIQFCDDRNGWQSSLQFLGGTTVGAEDPTRTSHTCPIMWPLIFLPRLPELKASGRLPPHIEAEIIFARVIFQRIASFLDVEEDHVEPLQLVRYEPGQFYRPHHDHGSFYGVTASEQRPVTLLLYLSDVPLDDGGGHTRFSKLDVAILPRAGDGILWNNVAVEDVMSEDGETLFLKKGDLLLDALHEAVPPRDEGEVVKYAMNVWISEKNIMEGIDSSALRTK